MYRPTEIKSLSEAYMAATGISANTLSTRILGRSNNRMIGRVIAGLDAVGSSIAAVSDFFNEHWPEDLPWPEDVLRQPRASNGKVAASEVAAAE